MRPGTGLDLKVGAGVRVTFEPVKVDREVLALVDDAPAATMLLDLDDAISAKVLPVRDSRRIMHPG